MPPYRSETRKENRRNLPKSLVARVSPEEPYLARGPMRQSLSTTAASRSVGTATLLRPRSNEAQTQSTGIAVGIALGLIAFVTALALIFCCYRTSRRRVKYGRSPGFSISAYFNDQREAQRRDLSPGEPVPRPPHEFKRFPGACNPIWTLFDDYSRGRPYNNSTRYSHRRPRGHSSRRVRRHRRRDGSICQPPRVYDCGDPPRLSPSYSSESLDTLDSPSICGHEHTGDDGGGGGGDSGRDATNIWRERQWYSASPSQNHPTPPTSCSAFDVCSPPSVGSPSSSSYPPSGSLQPPQPTTDERPSSGDGHSSTIRSSYDPGNAYAIENGSNLEPLTPPLQSLSNSGYTSYNPSGVRTVGSLSPTRQSTRDLDSSFSSGRLDYTLPYPQPPGTRTHTSGSYLGSSGPFYTYISQLDSPSSQPHRSTYSLGTNRLNYNHTVTGSSLSLVTLPPASSVVLGDIDPEVLLKRDSRSDLRTVSSTPTIEFSDLIVSPYGLEHRLGLGGRHQERLSDDSSYSSSICSGIAASAQGENEDFISDIASEAWDGFRHSPPNDTKCKRISRQPVGRPVTMEDGSDDDRPTKGTTMGQRSPDGVA